MKRPTQNKRILRIFLAFVLIVLIIGGRVFLDKIYVPAILMYHSVGGEGSFPEYYGSKLNVTPDTFQRQMKFLHNKGYNVISLEEFIERIKSGKRVPRKTVAITFDDGIRNNFSEAFPILKKYNFPATIFIPTGYVGKKKYLTWDQIKIMSENGIHMGSHTVTQRFLPDLPIEEVWEELAESKRTLEKETGHPVATLSYPIGGFTEKIRNLVKEAGYLGACATNPGKSYPDNDPYALKRVRISMTSNNMLVFWIETSGYYTFIKEVRDEE